MHEINGFWKELEYETAKVFLEGNRCPADPFILHPHSHRAFASRDWIVDSCLFKPSICIVRAERKEAFPEVQQTDHLDRREAWRKNDPRNSVHTPGE